MHRALQFGVLFILAVTQLPAAEIANLRNGFNILHEHHESLGEITRLYLDNETAGGSFLDVATSDITSFEPAPSEPNLPVSQSSRTQDLNAIIRNASARSRIDPDFIASVIYAESGNNPRAISRKGAQGLMQLMPETAKNLGVTNSFDPAENVDGGVRFLEELLDRYNDDAARALAAYNAGPARVEQYHGVPPFPETRSYIARVISNYNRLKSAQRRQQSKPVSAKAANSENKIQAIAEQAQTHPAGTN
jgi:soluble lytic murein transglycosylase-like protein